MSGAKPGPGVGARTASACRRRSSPPGAAAQPGGDASSALSSTLQIICLSAESETMGRSWPTSWRSVREERHAARARATPRPARRGRLQTVVSPSDSPRASPADRRMPLTMVLQRSIWRCISSISSRSSGSAANGGMRASRPGSPTAWPAACPARARRRRPAGPCARCAPPRRRAGAAAASWASRCAQVAADAADEDHQQRGIEQRSRSAGRCTYGLRSPQSWSSGSASGCRTASGRRSTGGDARPSSRSSAGAAAPRPGSPAAGRGR